MNRNLFGRVFVPVADPDDAAETARVVGEYVHADSHVYVAHVVEKGEGVPDKAAVDQREAFAEESFERFDEALSAAADGPTVEHVMLYRRDVAAAIIEDAEDRDATTVAFVPRGGKRWVKFLTGSTALDLVESSRVPVLSLPTEENRL